MIENDDNRGGLIVVYKMRILCGKFLNGCLGVFSWWKKGDFGWECVEMRDFERLFLSVGWGMVY